MTPHSPIEINEYLGGENALKVNKAAREATMERGRSRHPLMAAHNELIEARAKNDIPVDQGSGDVGTTPDAAKEEPEAAAAGGEGGEPPDEGKPPVATGGEEGEESPKEFQGSKAAKDAFTAYYGTGKAGQERFDAALAEGELDPPKGKDKWNVGDARDHVDTLRTKAPSPKIRLVKTRA